QSPPKQRKRKRDELEYSVEIPKSNISSGTKESIRMCASSSVDGRKKKNHLTSGSSSEYDSITSEVVQSEVVVNAISSDSESLSSSAKFSTSSASKTKPASLPSKSSTTSKSSKSELSAESEVSMKTSES